MPSRKLSGLISAPLTSASRAKSGLIKLATDYQEIKALNFCVQLDVVHVANQVRADPIIATRSDHTGAKAKTMTVIDECGSVSRGVKTQAPAKNVVKAAARKAKVAETIRRRLDLPSALIITIKPSVGGIQFHKVSLGPKLSCKAG